MKMIYITKRRRAKGPGMFRALSAALALAVLCGPAAAQSVSVTGVGGRAQALTAAVLAKLPHETVVLNDHGETTAFSGVSLRVLAAMAGAPEGEALRGPALSTVIVVGANDGYRVVLTLAEIDPGLGARRAILADAADGQALDARQGPFRLVVEGDKRPARSARNVVSIVLRVVE
jgi:hypothetical protein